MGVGSEDLSSLYKLAPYYVLKIVIFLLAASYDIDIERVQVMYLFIMEEVPPGIGRVREYDRNDSIHLHKGYYSN